MAHPRTTSFGPADVPKEPHSLSLKVLRLSRPSFATQQPLPISFPDSSLGTAINSAAALAYPTLEAPGTKDAFILSPVLTLPPSFGSAYVGETFSCTLCANNEMLMGAEPEKRISGVRIEAEMKTPTVTTPLDVLSAEEAAAVGSGSIPDPLGASGGDQEGEKGVDLEAGKTLQRIVEFHLKEEGNHVLAVTVSYTETGTTSGRVRSFRKLYQFVARGCLVVRTKIGPLPDWKGMKQLALEAQLENSGEETIVLETVVLDGKPWCRASSLNEMEDGNGPVMDPGEVQQVCFLVSQVNEEMLDHVDSNGRLLVGVLTIGWRGPMGNKGQLSTGWLGTRLVR